MLQYYILLLHLIALTTSGVYEIGAQIINKYKINLPKQIYEGIFINIYFFRKG